MNKGQYKPHSTISTGQLLQKKQNYNKTRDTQLNNDIQQNKYNKEYTYDYEKIIPHERPESIKKISPKKGQISLNKNNLKQQLTQSQKKNSQQKSNSSLKKSKQKQSQSYYNSPNKKSSIINSNQHGQINHNVQSRVFMDEVSQSQLQQQQIQQELNEKQRQQQIYKDYVMNNSQSQSRSFRSIEPSHIVNNMSNNLTNNMSILNTSQAMNTSKYDKVGKLHESRSSWVSPTKAPIKYIKYDNVVLHNKSKQQMRDMNCETLNQLLSSDNLFNDLFKGKKIGGKQNTLNQSKSQNQFNQVLDQSLINPNYHNNNYQQQQEQQRSPSNRSTKKLSIHQQSPRNNSKQYYFQSQKNNNQLLSPRNNQQTQQSTLQFIQSPQGSENNIQFNKSAATFSNLSTINKNQNDNSYNNNNPYFGQKDNNNPLMSTIKMNNTNGFNNTYDNQSFQSFSVTASPRKRVSIKNKPSINKEKLEEQINQSINRNTAYDREWVQDVEKELNTSVSRLQNGKICIQDNENTTVVTTDMTNQRILNRINYLKNNEGLSQSSVQILNKSTQKVMESTIQNFDQNASMMRSNLYGSNQNLEQQESGYCNLNETLNKSTNRLSFNSNPTIVRQALNVKCPHLIEKAMYCNICNRKIISQPQTYNKIQNY